MKAVFFFPTGVTAVTDGHSQIPELQEAWAELFAKFLESKGEDPTEVELKFPDGKVTRYFKTDNGWNWG